MYRCSHTHTHLSLSLFSILDKAHLLVEVRLFFHVWCYVVYCVVWCIVFRKDTAMWATVRQQLESVSESTIHCCEGLVSPITTLEFGNTLNERVKAIEWCVVQRQPDAPAALMVKHTHTHINQSTQHGHNLHNKV